MPNTETILYCPLNWGLGHATRMVPLIQKSISQGHKLIIGASGAPLAFLQQEFPELETILIKGFKMNYWPRPFFNLGLLLKMPLFYASIFTEQLSIKRIVKHRNIGTIISDNRYGIYTKKTKNILITHQLFIKVPKVFKWSERLVHRLTRNFILKFDECWVPDYADINQSLAGELSHGKNVPSNVKYIGPLSRFQNFIPPYASEPTLIPEVLILISGPEPQRSHFENEMEKRFINSPNKVLMVCGRPGNTIKTESGQFHKVQHLSTNELFWYLTKSNKIITRCGYSTLMDLHVLNLRADLSPTPGQSEQEYLFEYNTNMSFSKNHTK